MRETSGKLRFFCTAVFILYFFVLLYFTVFAESLGRVYEGGMSEARYNLVPFEEIRRFIKYREMLGMKAVLMNIPGNFLIFLPCGVLIPVIYPRASGWAGCALAGCILSFIIESAQAVFRVGSFDVDDIILNTLGALCGWLLYSFVGYLRRRRRTSREVVIRKLE